ncbi:hypothetical protein [uncultured Limosilactobacillus sp.]|uniref:hypothetical protein n=1 Tax=uncultured Limosilactobacillus sp. TaxID=2837629 RepID=UPI0025941661|nr:hypothetical protein [uncultured Limosilactobacillus sp.]
MKSFFKNQRLTAGVALVSLVLLVITALPSLHTPKWLQIIILMVFLVCAVVFTVSSGLDRYRNHQ